MKIKVQFFIYFFLLILTTSAFPGELQFGKLGDFKLKSGEYIRDCQIGFRTFGKLNADKSNIILFPTWHLGTTEQLISEISRGLIDSTKYYIITVDALCNGVSSSPSNSKLQPRMSFPEVTIEDMVNTQHELLTKILNINHIKCVLGISMGGMQTFQWMVSYPDFMDKVIPIVGSPRVPPYDLVLHRSQIRQIMSDPDWKNGNYTVNPARIAAAEFFALTLTTPEDFNKNHTRENTFEEIDKAKETNGDDSNDRLRQLQAMMKLDVSLPFGGQLKDAAAVVKAKTFIITSLKDHIVSPAPAIEFAGLLNCKILKLDSDCGHLAPGCEASLVNKSIAEFLEE